MANSKKSLNNAIREKYMKAVIEYLSGLDEEVLVTNSNEIAIPCVDAEGNDEFLVMTFKVPQGSRDGDPYDGYDAAEAYAEKVASNAKKAEERAEAKARKIARDKAIREAKAQAKAERVAKVE